MSEDRKTVSGLYFMILLFSQPQAEYSITFEALNKKT